jgi:hypothetical protein
VEQKGIYFVKGYKTRGVHLTYFNCKVRVSISKPMKISISI